MSEAPTRHAPARSAAASKSEHVVRFLTPLLQAYFGAAGRDGPAGRGASTAPPFFLGVNGIQGSGKTTLVQQVAEALRGPAWGLRTAVLSIDDLYLPRGEQQRLAQSHPANPLVQHRGQPGTHDVALGRAVFDALRQGKTTRVPAYDKSAFQGAGDRVPASAWAVVNEGAAKIDVVLFEGWCVGFRPLARAAVADKWRAAVQQRDAAASTYAGRLGWNSEASVQFINEQLRQYDQLTDCLDALVHIDCADTRWVYEWRLQQEQELRRTKGGGMTDAQVRQFVDGYYPAYELFYATLRQGIFDQPGRQLRLIVDRERAVDAVVQI